MAVNFSSFCVLGCALEEDLQVGEPSALGGQRAKRPSGGKPGANQGGHLQTEPAHTLTMNMHPISLNPKP